MIAAATEADPAAAASEWQGQFRRDLSSFLDDRDIDAAVDIDRPAELPPRKLKYTCFVDPSGGRHDAFALCIGHKEGDAFIADVVRGVRAPFDPVEVTKTYAALCREYNITEVKGDNYSAEWVTQAFRDAVHQVRARREA